MIVPFNTSDFACLAPNARRDVDVFADFRGALRASTRNWTRMCRDLLNLHRLRIAHRHTFSIFTRKPLYSGVNAFGSIAAGDNWLTGLRAVLPSSSLMPRYPQ